MDKEEPKQLKLTNRTDGSSVKDKKEKKEIEPKANKWLVIAILIVTIVLSLFFYFSGARKRPVEQDQNIPGQTQEQGSPLGGEKVYQF